MWVRIPPGAPGHERGTTRATTQPSYDAGPGRARARLSAGAAMECGATRSEPTEPVFGAQVRRRLAGAVTPVARRVLLAGVLAVGVAGAVAVALWADPAGRSAVQVLAAAHLLMSVPLPLVGVLLAQDTVRDGDARRPGPAILAAVLCAAVVAVLGSAAGLLVAFLVPGAGIGTAGALAAVVVGGIGVQVLAQLVGTGLGFLVRSAAVAFLGTILLPLGAWLLLRPLGSAWLTPFGAQAALLSGATSSTDVLRWLVVLALWGGLLNLAGVALLARRRLGQVAR